MGARTRSLVLAFWVVGSLVACGDDDDVGVGASSTTTEPPPPELVVTATYEGIELSADSIPSGEVLVTMEGDSNGSPVDLTLVEEGTTAEEFRRARLDQDDPGGGPTITLHSGDPGVEVRSISLAPGTYVVWAAIEGPSELGGFSSPEPGVAIGGAPPIALVAAAFTVEPADR